MNESTRTFSGKAMRAAEDALEGNERLAEYVYEMMSKINHAEDGIRREAASIQRDSASVLTDLGNGYRLAPVDTSRLNEYIAKRQSGYDALAALLGEEELNRYRAM
jgi:hypothetical protein